MQPKDSDGNLLSRSHFTNGPSRGTQVKLLFLTWSNSSKRHSPGNEDFLWAPGPSPAARPPRPHSWDWRERSPRSSSQAPLWPLDPGREKATLLLPPAATDVCKALPLRGPPKSLRGLPLPAPTREAPGGIPLTEGQGRLLQGGPRRPRKACALADPTPRPPEPSPEVTSGAQPPGRPGLQELPEQPQPCPELQLSGRSRLLLGAERCYYLQTLLSIDTAGLRGGVEVRAAAAPPGPATTSWGRVLPRRRAPREGVRPALQRGKLRPGEAPPRRQVGGMLDPLGDTPATLTRKP